jgi:hypothetical protein
VAVADQRERDHACTRGPTPHTGRGVKTDRPGVRGERVANRHGRAGTASTPRAAPVKVEVRVMGARVRRGGTGPLPPDYLPAAAGASGDVFDDRILPISVRDLMNRLRGIH